MTHVSGLLTMHIRYYRVENTQEDILNRVFLIIWINAFNSCEETNSWFPFMWNVHRTCSEPSPTLVWEGTKGRALSLYRTLFVSPRLKGAVFSVPVLCCRPSPLTTPVENRLLTHKS